MEDSSFYPLLVKNLEELERLLRCHSVIDTIMEQTLSPELTQPITVSESDSLPPDQIDPTFASSTLDLISAPLGSKILYVSDEFFAPAQNLLTPTPPISRPGVFVPTGAWYDGWESRRHNRHPYDQVIIRLGVAAGIVKGVEIDTAFFTGNHAPEISVEGCYEDVDEKVVEDGFNGWRTVLGRKKCEPNRRHAWLVGPAIGGAGVISSAVGAVAAAIAGDGKASGKAESSTSAETPYDGKPITHVRLRMYPDGGIARFRLYGTAVPIWPSPSSDQVLELSAAKNGGLATSASDQHYGRASNLLLPGRGADMGDGWETKRSRAPGHVDWAVVRLGAPAEVQRIVVDTMHFRGNFPREVRVALGRFFDGEDRRESRMDVRAEEEGWVEVASCAEMKADTEFQFFVEALSGKVWTHAKLTMVPDGGVKRFRVFGRRAQ